MIDSPAKLSYLRTSLAHAVNRLSTPDACDVYSPPDLRELISRYIKAGGRFEELFRHFEDAEWPAEPSRKLGRWATASTLVSPVAVHAGAH